MKKFSVFLSEQQIETINKVLSYENLGPVDFKPLEFIRISDVMVLTISRLAWLYSINLSRVEMDRMLEFLDDIIHDSCSKSARHKSDEIINIK